MGKHFENLEEVMCSELDKLNRKYASDPGEMTTQDVEKIDVLYHALKSAATYHAMKEAEEDGEEDEESGRSYRSYARGGRSYARRRDAMGRYSRDMGGASGHYPMMYPRYPMSYEDGGDWRY